MTTPTSESVPVLSASTELSALAGWLEWAATHYAGIPSANIVRQAEDRIADLERALFAIVDSKETDLREFASWVVVRAQAALTSEAHRG